MKFLQQDDIFDAQFQNKLIRYYFNGKMVKAKNRQDAQVKFKEHFGIVAPRQLVTNEKQKEVIFNCPNDIIESITKVYEINDKDFLISAIRKITTLSQKAQYQGWFEDYFDEWIMQVSEGEK